MYVHIYYIYIYIIYNKMIILYIIYDNIVYIFQYFFALVSFSFPDTVSGASVLFPDVW